MVPRVAPSPEPDIFRALAPGERAPNPDGDPVVFPPPHDAESKSLEILHRIRAGEEQGWQELYRVYHDEMLFVARAQLGPRLRCVLETEDVFQSVALDALQSLRRFEYRGTGSLRSYLHRMVINKIRDRADTWKAKKRAGSVALTEGMAEKLAQPEDEPGYFEAARYEKLEAALERLPDEMRAAVVLRRIEGLNGRETAERLGKTEAATRKLYSRALARLGAMMTGGTSDE